MVRKCSPGLCQFWFIASISHSWIFGDPFAAVVPFDATKKNSVRRLRSGVWRPTMTSTAAKVRRSSCGDEQVYLATALRQVIQVRGREGEGTGLLPRQSLLHRQFAFLLGDGAVETTMGEWPKISSSVGVPSRSWRSDACRTTASRHESQAASSAWQRSPLPETHRVSDRGGQTWNESMPLVH